MGTGALTIGTGDRHIAGSLTSVIVRYVERVLGPDAVAGLVGVAGDARPLVEIVDMAGWSSHTQACALLEAAAEITGDPDVGFRVGEEMLRQHAGTEVAALLRSLGSPGELLRNIAATASKFSPVTVLEAVRVGDTSATVCASGGAGFIRHPLLCDHTAGLLSQASVLFGMEPAVVTEPACQLRGDPVCRYEVRWDPSTGSTGAAGDADRRVEHLEAQLAGLTERFEALQATAVELVSATDVETLLARIAHRAGLAVCAPGHVLAVQLPGEVDLRVHSAGIDPVERSRIVAEILGPDTAVDGRLVVDVVSASHHYGRLAALYPAGYGFFEQEQRLLVAYAAQAAAALDTATALREVSRRNETARVLLRLSTELANVASPDEVAQRIAAAVQTVVDCDHATVLLWNPESQVLAMRASVGLRPKAERVFGALAISPTDTPVVQGLLDDRQPYFIGPEDSDPFMRGLLELAESEASVLVPISAGAAFFGVITAGVYVGSDRLRAEDHVVERLEGLAAQAAAALDNARLLDEVSHRALHDPLTGLPNRALLRDRLTHALLRARRSGCSVGVIYADLDGFKCINDDHGHAVGDDVIITAAERIRAALRPGDTVARVGGDEFAIVLPDMVDGSRCDVVARKVLDELRRPMHVAGHAFELTASLGAVAGTACDTYDDLVKRADVAMYAAKRAGRNTFVVAADD